MAFCCAHCSISCKISALTDKNYGNENKTVCASEDCFAPQLLPFKSLTKKHVNLGNLLGGPRTFFSFKLDTAIPREICPEYLYQTDAK